MSVLLGYFSFMETQLVNFFTKSQRVHVRGFFLPGMTHLSAAMLSIVLLMRGYEARTALKWSTDSENRLQ